MNNRTRCLLSVALLNLIAACASLPDPTPQAVESQPSHTGIYFLESETETKPKLKSTKAPIYPVQWRAQGVEGEAVTDFIIDERGFPTEVQFLRATDQAFADAAVASVKKWRFTPGLKDGRPTRVWMVVPIVFEMKR